MNILYVLPDGDVSGYIIIPERSSKIVLPDNINCLYELVFSKRVDETGQSLSY